MKTFDYEAPVTIDQTITMMSKTHGQILLLAGGTDLLVQLRSGNKDVDLVIDVKGIPEPVSYTHLTLPTTPYV